MIISRVVFNLKFGKAKESIAIWKEIYQKVKQSPHAPQMRLLTDMTGHSYRLIHEMHLKSFLDLNEINALWMNSDEVKALYQKFVPLCDSADREMYKIEYIV
jgi:hypothetical protein